MKNRQIDQLLEGHTVIRTANGLKIRRKPGPKREQVLKSAAFAGTRRSLADFLQASRHGKVLRQALHEVIQPVKDKGMHNRLTSQLYKVVSSGQGAIDQLRRFEFGGVRHTLGNTFRSNYSTHIDVANRCAWVDIPAFKPKTQLRGAGGATHVRFRMVFAMIDFDAGTVVRKSVISAPVPINNKLTERQRLQVQLPEGTMGNGYLAFSIGFFDGEVELRGGAAVMAEVAEAPAMAEETTRVIPAAQKVPPRRQQQAWRIPRIAITFKRPHRRLARQRIHRGCMQTAAG
ncbi:hypothetical protein MKQ68_12755 [Chitinophaga horti]|uniref:Transposase n=1 Tax=Chitinophaga horti TaxID=2920382 RepID=A0ABY6IUB6_9BACT|nr:hypothetical protein [Chitinophaga horti]UYQ90964.1 hypothetical protein MKQ68_12755 [Chitinophaga horti]